MSITDNQQRTFLKLAAELRPHWRRDPALPARIQALLARHREFGSRDRRLYRELIYTTLRHLPWIEPLLEAQTDEAVRRVAWFAAEVPATGLFRTAFATGEYPAGDKSELLPAWFKPHCPEIFAGAELEAQLRRAPVWLRLQANPATPVLDEFARREWRWHQSAVLPRAIQLLSDADVTISEAWRQGHFEIQDFGSQLLLESIGVEPGGSWLDACAGAGGKTLQLAELLGGGHIDAHDIRPAALDELRTRVRRARHVCHLLDDKRYETPGGAHSDVGHLIDGKRRTTIRVLGGSGVDRGAAYDGVLVDAPCSGSGTWRRAPHLKWITTDAQIARAAETQRALLDRFAGHVKPGGRLVYATCSLSSRENEAVVASFLETHPDFRPQPFAKTFAATPRGAGLLILPAQHDSDGFFVASLRREPATASNSGI